MNKREQLKTSIFEAIDVVSDLQYAEPNEAAYSILARIKTHLEDAYLILMDMTPNKK
jgi:hypothetical protein